MFAVLSEFQKARFVAQGIPSERVEVVPNFASDLPDGAGQADIAGEADGGRAVAQEDGGGWISYLGRVSPEKGVDLFCRAAGQLPQAQFAIAGDASRMPGLAASAPSNVAFRGFLSGAAKAEFLRRSRIVVVPSVCLEGFPNVITDAMSRGLPVVCSRLGCLGEIVEDGVTGLTFEPGSADDLTARLRYLLDRPQECRRMGQAGRRKCWSDIRRGRSTSGGWTSIARR